jgi:hypothetical protein
VLYMLFFKFLDIMGQNIIQASHVLILEVAISKILCNCFNYTKNRDLSDRLCVSLVKVPGYRTTDQGLIPGATRFSEKKWTWNGVHSASWVQLRSYLIEK